MEIRAYPGAESNVFFQQNSSLKNAILVAIHCFQFCQREDERADDCLTRLFSLGADGAESLFSGTKVSFGGGALPVDLWEG